IHTIGLSACESDKVVRKLECFAFLRGIDAQLSFRISLNANQRHRLPETSFDSRAFQSHRFKLLGDVKRSQLAAACASAAPFETIIREEFDVRSQGVLANRTYNFPDT